MTNQEILQEQGQAVYTWILDVFHNGASLEDIETSMIDPDEVQNSMAKALAFLDEFDLPLTLDNLQSYASDIYNWDGSTATTLPINPTVPEQPTELKKPCIPCQNATEIKSLKKKGILAFVIIILILIIKS